MSNISQQAVAVETAIRILSGGALKPSQREKEHILNGLRAASTTLRNLEHDRRAM